MTRSYNDRLNIAAAAIDIAIESLGEMRDDLDAAGNLRAYKPYKLSSWDVYEMECTLWNQLEAVWELYCATEDVSYPEIGLLRNYQQQHPENQRGIERACMALELATANLHAAVTDLVQRDYDDATDQNLIGTCWVVQSAEAYLYSVLWMEKSLADLLDAAGIDPECEIESAGLRWRVAAAAVTAVVADEPTYVSR